MRALILGGTAESRELALLLLQSGWRVTSSLAGRVKEPKLPLGEVRIGGFGGPPGLARWLMDHEVDLVVDATHPFAEKISISAAEATRATGIPLIALHRPAWTPENYDEWIYVNDMEEAARMAERYHHIFLTIGRQKLAPFANDSHNLYVIRSVDPPEGPLPKRHRLILSRGPFSVQDEKQLMRDNQIDALVTKNFRRQPYLRQNRSGPPTWHSSDHGPAPLLPGGSRITAVHTASDAYIAAHG